MKKMTTKKLLTESSFEDITAGVYDSEPTSEAQVYSLNAEAFEGESSSPQSLSDGQPTRRVRKVNLGTQGFTRSGTMMDSAFERGGLIKKPEEVLRLEKILTGEYNKHVRVTRVRDLPSTIKEVVKEISFSIASR